MNKETIYIFDTTLRDGAQTEGVDFSIEEKNKIAKVLSDIIILKSSISISSNFIDTIFEIMLSITLLSKLFLI